MPTVPFKPRHMKISLLTAAVQELTARERRDADPDLAVEEWLHFASRLDCPFIQLSAALHPSRTDVPPEAMLDPVANTLDLRSAFDASRARRVRAAMQASRVGLSDLAYFDNMLVADPQARRVKHEFMLRVFDAAVALGADAVCGFVGRNPALQMDENQVSDWALPDRGVIKGEALQNFINRSLGNKPLEKLVKPFGVVATDLASGESIVFRTGNAGMAVRASSSVPGVFQPVAINGREYVDGGLVSPVPVRAAKGLGADFVIAVDISAKPQYGKTQSSIDVLLQTFAIMGQSISKYELAEADVVIRPQTAEIKAMDFQARHLAVLEGEKAVATVLPDLRAKLARLREH